MYNLYAKHLRGGPFDIQGGGGRFVFYWESRYFFGVHMKPDNFFFLIISKPDHFFGLDIRARYFLCVCIII